jgi:hypothetical protein
MKNGIPKFLGIEVLSLPVIQMKNGMDLPCGCVGVLDDWDSVLTGSFKYLFDGFDSTSNIDFVTTQFAEVFAGAVFEISLKYFGVTP